MEANVSDRTRATSRRWRWIAVAGGLLGGFTLAQGGGVAAAPPPPLGADESAQLARIWSTFQDDPIGFLVPSTIAAAPDGSVYGIANYSSGSSQAIIHDASDGTRIGSWYSPDAYPIGLAVGPSGTAFVLTVNFSSGLQEVVGYGPTGAVLSTAVLAGASSSIVGLAVSPDGSTFYTLDTSVFPHEIAVYSAGGALLSAFPVPGISVGYAGFNLNLGADGRLYFFGRQSDPPYDSYLVSVNVDGSDLSTVVAPTNTTQVAVGQDARLYLLGNDGSVAAIDQSGAVTQIVPQSVYAPGGANAIGVTADAEGNIFVSGYFYAPTGSSVGGIAALQTLRSPSIVGGALAPALACSTYESTFSATGTPTPTYFELASGALPAGVVLNSDTGELTGTPAGPAGAFAFTIRALNGVIATPDTTTSDTAEYTLDVDLNEFVTAPPAVLGTPALGSTLSAAIPAWTPEPTARAYQWLRDGEPITSATAASYVVVADDLGTQVSVAVIGTAACYSDASTISSALVVPDPAPDPDPAPEPDPAPTPSAANAARDDDLAQTGGDLADVLPLVATAAGAIGIGLLILRRRSNRMSNRD